MYAVGIVLTVFGFIMSIKTILFLGDKSNV
jgi:hypothetical protein